MRRKPRTDQVSEDLAQAVFKRDQGCVAPRLGGSIMDCWGRATVAHVKVQPRMSKRAEPQMDRLVEVCQGHMEDGMRAGYVWVTDRHNIEKMRDYLREKHPNGA